MVTLNIGSIRSSLVTEKKNILEGVASYLRYRDKNYKYTRAYEEGRWDGWHNLYKYGGGRLSFRTGLAPIVAKLLEDEGVPFEIENFRKKPDLAVSPLVGDLYGIQLYEYQESLIESIASPRLLESNSGLCVIPDAEEQGLNIDLGVSSDYRIPGWGIWSSATGCHAPDSPIMMWDGRCKKVQDIKKSDLLLGPGGTVRSVLELIRGKGEMYCVVPYGGDRFAVNKDHVLSLIHDDTDEIIDVSLRDWLEWDLVKKDKYRLFRTAVESFPGRNWDKRDLFYEPDPYDFGLSLQDCSRRKNRISGVYLFAPKDVRLEVLSGILKGSRFVDREYHFISESESLARDIVFLSRSVGRDANKYAIGLDEGRYVVVLSNESSSVIKNKFSVSYEGVGPYYGFCLDGDGRYLLPDFIVTHNSGKTEAAIGLVAKLGVKTLFTVYGNSLVRQSKERFQSRLTPWMHSNGVTVSSSTGGNLKDTFISIVSSSTLSAMYLRPERLLKGMKKWKRGAFNKAFHCLRDYDVDGAERHISKLSGKGLERGIEYWERLIEDMRSALERRNVVLSFLQSIDLLIIDEGHKAAAEQTVSVLEHCPAYYRVCMSGTPKDRSDNKNLVTVSLFGDTVANLTNKDMSERGVIPKTKITMIPVKGPRVQANYKEVRSGETVRRMIDHTDLEDKGISQYFIRNRKIIRKVQEHYHKGERILVLFKRKDHGRILSQMLWCQDDIDGEGSFIPHEVCDGEYDEPIENIRVDGDDPDDVRRAAIDKFKSGVVRVLFASDIFGTGLDIPEIDVLILAAGGKSTIDTKQRLGRGLRGNELQVYDFLDMHHKKLAQHAKERLQIYMNEDCFEIEMDK